MKLKITIITLSLLVSGCGYTPHIIRKYEVRVPSFKLIVVEHKSQLPCGNVGCARTLLGYRFDEKLIGIVGYELYIVGEWTNEGINIPDYFLGHELRHILYWVDPKIKHPHLDWEYKLLGKE